MKYAAQAKFLLFLILFLGSAGKVFAADGDLDTSFDGDGVVITDLGLTSEAVLDLVVQPDGKIVAMGYSNQNLIKQVVIVRYDPNGSVDMSFGTNGKVILQLPYPGKLALQPDGKIVFVADSEESSNRDFLVVRLNSNGSFDTTFNTSGVVILDLRGTNDSANAVKIQPDGKIVVGGTSERPVASDGVGPVDDHAVVRLNANGTLDTTFDGDGKAITSISPEGRDSLVDLLVQHDGKIVTAGNSVRPNQGSSFNILFLVVRYNANGSLDTTFDGDGKVFTQVGQQYGQVTSSAMQCDGKIVVAGTASSVNGNRIGLVRYHRDGSLDFSFGTDGILITRNPWGPESTARDMAIQADNKIIVVGTVGSPKISVMSVGRFNSNGLPDSSFNNGGWNVVDLPATLSYADAIQPDGKIVIGGYHNPGGGGDYFLARFSASSGPTNCTDKVADFDGDGRSDYSIYRNGLWAVRPSNNIDTFYAVEFGLASDRITPADFDGDGRTDIAVFRNGIWYLQRSLLGFTAIQFGQVEDIPIPADYDGDGRADVAVFRSGAWHILGSQTGYYAFFFGLSTDKPVPGNFDSDGKTDPAVYRNGAWYMLRSQGGFAAVSFGLAADRPVARDYDGDGIADPAVFRSGTWYVLGSTQGFYAFHFGFSSDDPIPADYDGDSKTDISVFRDGTWYLQRSTLGFTAATLGVPGDRPIPAAYVPWSAPGPW